MILLRICTVASRENHPMLTILDDGRVVRLRWTRWRMIGCRVLLRV